MLYPQAIIPFPCLNGGQDLLPLFDHWRSWALEWGWSDWMGHHSQDLDPILNPSRTISNVLSLGLVLKVACREALGTILGDGRPTGSYSPHPICLNTLGWSGSPLGHRCGGGSLEKTLHQPAPPVSVGHWKDLHQLRGAKTLTISHSCLG